MKNISVQSKGVTTYTPPTRSFKGSRYAALGLCMAFYYPFHLISMQHSLPMFYPACLSNKPVKLQ